MPCQIISSFSPISYVDNPRSKVLHLTCSQHHLSVLWRLLTTKPISLYHLQIELTH
uniref:Uncharacterized protein n=1 Tax=Rhizophora mucronata TaxID=61149 RepID=A0A2P2IZF0_RHIMU